MSQRRILIVDDESYLTQILTFNLERAGDEVIVADDGEAAYRLACDRLPDVVISDFQMPVMDGLSFSIKLRQNARTAHIPVIMLTGRGHLIEPSAVARTNICCLLPKPFSCVQLMQKLNEIAGKVSVDASQSAKSGTIR